MSPPSPHKANVFHMHVVKTYDYKVITLLKYNTLTTRGEFFDPDLKVRNIVLLCLRTEYTCGVQ